MPTPNTTTRTDHSLSITVDGKLIGMIQDWSPQMSRTITPVYEINPDTSGEVLENVPGNISGLTMSVNRFDLFKVKMEQVWGSNFNIQMLTDQTNPITVKEKWKNPDGTTEVWVYYGCWFNSLGRNHSANGDRITKVNASLTYVKKEQVA